MTDTAHIPVLPDEVIAALLPDGEADVIVDGTLGAGGHTKLLLERGAKQVIAFDLDPQAIAIATQKLKAFGDRVHIINDSYANMTQHVQALGWDHVDGILLDLGVSSMQFDTPERGFAFRYDAPLDMRFTPDDGRPSAADIVNSWQADDLADIFFRYGEERHSRKIARDIVAERPLHTTTELAELIARSVPQKWRSGDIHPATRVFQALRIAVNDELGTVERALPLAVDLLKSGGRLAVISFHSLEDRIVKQYFKEASTEVISPPGMASIKPRAAQIHLINRKPIVPSAAEIDANPRSRSSKLRIAEKC